MFWFLKWYIFSIGHSCNHLFFAPLKYPWLSSLHMSIYTTIRCLYITISCLHTTTGCFYTTSYFRIARSWQPCQMCYKSHILSRSWSSTYSFNKETNMWLVKLNKIWKVLSPYGLWSIEGINKLRCHVIYIFQGRENPFKDGLLRNSW